MMKVLPTQHFQWLFLVHEHIIKYKRSMILDESTREFYTSMRSNAGLSFPSLCEFILQRSYVTQTSFFKVLVLANFDVYTMKCERVFYTIYNNL